MVSINDTNISRWTPINAVLRDMRITRNRISESIGMPLNERIFYMPPSYTVSTEKDQRFTPECRKSNNFFVSDQIQLAEQCILFRQRFTRKMFLFLSKPHTVN